MLAYQTPRFCGNLQWSWNSCFQNNKLSTLVYCCFDSCCTRYISINKVIRYCSQSEVVNGIFVKPSAEQLIPLHNFREWISSSTGIYIICAIENEMLVCILKSDKWKLVEIWYSRSYIQANHSYWKLLAPGVIKILAKHIAKLNPLLRLCCTILWKRN